MESIIKLESVNFWYNHNQASQTQALKDINLDILPGEYVAFFGPSGSGKTTLLYLLSGIEQSQEGKILINGRNIAEFSKQELAIYRQVGVGMVFQQFNLIPTLSVLNNVALPMAFLGVKAARREEEAGKLLERLDIANLGNRFPHELSGGQQQRVGIARALANNAPIIIADEPLGNLDSENSNRVMSFLKDLNEKDKRTIIMVTHEAWSLKDVKKVFYIKDGEIKKTEIGSSNLVRSVSQHLFGEMNPELSNLEIAAKSLSNLFLRGHSQTEIESFEKNLLDRLNDKLSKEKFLYFLDRPVSEEGMGLWWQKAVKISNYIEDIIAEQGKIDILLKELEARPTRPLNDELAQVCGWLLGDRQLTGSEKSIFQEAVGKRLRNEIDTKGFLSLIRTPKKTGTGLATKAATLIAEKYEMALKNRSLPLET